MYRLNTIQQQQQQEQKPELKQQHHRTTGGQSQIERSLPSHVALKQQLVAAGTADSLLPSTFFESSARQGHAALTLYVANGGGTTATATTDEDKLRRTPTTIKTELMADIVSLSGAHGGASGATAAPGCSLKASTAVAATATAASIAAAASVASTSAAAAVVAANGNLVLGPNKRARLDMPEDWMAASPGSAPSSAPPLSPSPGSQNHSYNMSNGYASPTSAGSYDPYSPNGKTGESQAGCSS
ncbi:hypothetical protein KR018_008834 [Drosophila ironensis]|nr:hypothetical protein KR018_008834 [Drosophila ironensis]